MGKPKVLVLIVSYNAEKTISRLLSRFDKKTLNSVDEILVADDASNDATSLVASWFKEANKIKKIRIVKHSKNKGYGGNQKWGYEYAINKKFDIVIIIHGDAQYPPEYILPLIKKLTDEKADFVFGSRMAGHPLKGRMPLYKFFGNKFLTFIENVALGTKLTEFHSGFRAYNVHALKELPLMENSDEFYFDSEIIFQLVQRKKKIREITIPTFYGDEKSNVRVISYGLGILKELFKLKLHTLGLKRSKKYSSGMNKL